MNVLLYFWHPYCTFCVRDYRKLAEFYREKRKEYNFVILSIASIYGPSQQDEAEKLADEIDSVFPTLNDAESEVGNLYDIRHVPTLFVINKNGVIVDAYQGETRNVPGRLAPVFEYISEPEEF